MKWQCITTPQPQSEIDRVAELVNAIEGKLYLSDDEAARLIGLSWQLSTIAQEKELGGYSEVRPCF